MMDRSFLSGATADLFVLDRTVINEGGSRLLSHAEAKQMAADAAAKANGLTEPPRYERHLTIPTRRLQRWEWWVTVGVGGERETVVGPRRAWTKRAADRRAFRHYARLTEQAARLTREAAKR